MSRSLVLIGVVAACLLSGCSFGADIEGPAEASVAFYSAIAAGQSNRACELLADQTRDKLESSDGSNCPVALAKLGLTSEKVSRADVYGRFALVEMNSDTLFLAQQSSGWRIIAAGCTEQKDKPYDCQLEAN